MKCTTTKNVQILSSTLYQFSSRHALLEVFQNFSGNHFLEWYHDFFLIFLKVGVLKFLKFYRSEDFPKSAVVDSFFFPSFSFFSLPCTTTNKQVSSSKLPNFHLCILCLTISKSSSILFLEWYDDFFSKFSKVGVPNLSSLDY